MMPYGSPRLSCSDSFRPTQCAWILLAICLFPMLAMAAGFDFGSPCTAPGSSELNAVAGEPWHEVVHTSARGSYTHTILEWTAVCAAVFAAILAFCLFSVVREPSLPVIGIAMLCAGLMDGFHTLAADRLIQATASNTELVPFTWAVCRLFNATIMMAGVGLFAFGRRIADPVRTRTVAAACVFFLLIAWGILSVCTQAAHLPQTMFTDALITRPYDIASVVPFAVCGLVVFPRYLRRNPSCFAWSLQMSLIPQIATQLYMAFGSAQLHDSYFNIAHGLKVVGYAMPAIGLLFTYQRAFGDLRATRVRMAKSVHAEKIADQTVLLSAEARSETDILSRCANGISKLSHWETGRISYVVQQDDEIRIQPSGIWQDRSAIESAVRDFTAAPVPLDQAADVVAQVWKNREPVIIEDLLATAKLNPLVSPPTAETRSVFAFPVLVAGEIIAILEFASRRPAVVEPELRTAIDQLIRRVAMCIERRREQDALQISEQRFHLAVAGSNDGIWDWDVQSGKTWFSPRFRELLCCAADDVDLLMNQWLERLHDDDRERATDALENHLKGYQPFDVEYRLLCNNGEYRWFRSRGQAVWNEFCEPTRMAGSLTDITAQKQAEQEIADAQQALFASEQHLRAMIDATPECVKVIDREGRILEINAVGLLLTEFDHADQVLGECIYDVIDPADRPSFIAFNERICDGDRGTLEFNIIGARGTHRVMETSAVPLTMQDGRRVHLGITREVTQQKRRNAALRNAKEAAESANRAKSEFLANMSHEIRTPMNGILGMTELALGTSLDEEQTEYLETVRDSGESLLATINDILDFSKVEAGMLRLETTPFQLRELLSVAMKPLQMRAAQKNLDCRWTVADQVPATMVGDGHRLQQILTNLVGNAVKFTETGSVHVLVDCEENGPNWHRLLVSVADTGLGIPADKQCRIFDAFSQADTSTTRNFGGTGLGLAITTQLVELMGGTISVDSVPGQGTTFRFTANFGVCQQATGPHKDSEQTARLDSRPLQVLLAEDNRVNQRFAQRLLEKQGHHVTIADDGQKAVELARTLLPDVILMDIQMPELDGYQATRAIRQLEAEGQPRTPIVAMTAHAMKGDREKCLASGMDDYVTKPVRKAELFDVLRRVTAESVSPVEQPD